MSRKCIIINFEFFVNNLNFDNFIDKSKPKEKKQNSNKK